MVEMADQPCHIYTILAQVSEKNANVPGLSNSQRVAQTNFIATHVKELPYSLQHGFRRRLTIKGVCKDA